MQFTSVDDQILAICAAATNASSPVGLGVHHFREGKMLPMQFMGDIEGQLGARCVRLDYVDGRMVKLHMREIAPGTWRTRNHVHTDRQSWAWKYECAAELVRSVGAVVTDEQDDGGD